MLMKYKNFKTLSQNEMKNLVGGNVPASGCLIKRSGQEPYGTSYSGTCAQQSAQANSECLTWISSNPGGSCGYDCGCDGWGV
jgi:hypothetical protein